MASRSERANRQEIIKPLASSRFSPLINACHKNGGRNWRRGEGGCLNIGGAIEKEIFLAGQKLDAEIKRWTARDLPPPLNNYFIPAPILFPLLLPFVTCGFSFLGAVYLWPLIFIRSLIWAGFFFLLLLRLLFLPAHSIAPFIFITAHYFVFFSFWFGP